MKKSDPQNRSLERQLFLAKLVQKKLHRAKNDYIIFPIKEFEEYTLLNDFENLQLTLKRINQELKNDFEYEIQSRAGISNAADYDMKNPSKIPTSIKIIIENKSEFEKYIVELERKLIKEENHYDFLLNEERQLFLKGSKIDPYQIEKDSLRYELIFYLAKKKDFIGAQELANRFNTSPDRIRKTIGQIREMIKKRFKISGYSLIKTDGSTGGYCINNLTPKVPKGYTPS